MLRQLCIMNYYYSIHIFSVFFHEFSFYVHICSICKVVHQYDLQVGWKICSKPGLCLHSGGICTVTISWFSEVLNSVMFSF